MTGNIFFRANTSDDITWLQW